MALGGVGVEGYVDLLQHLRDLTGQERPVPEVFVELYSARYVVVLADGPMWSIDTADRSRREEADLGSDFGQMRVDGILDHVHFCLQGAPQQQS